MARSANKTKPTAASIDEYIASRADDQPRRDCEALMALLGRLTKQSPVMWGPSIVGFGSYRYTYATGHTGEAPVAGFAIRGRELVVYLAPDHAGQRSLLSKLGPHRMTGCCLYVKRLADLDRSALEKLVADSVAEVRRLHG